MKSKNSHAKSASAESVYFSGESRDAIVDLLLGLPRVFREVLLLAIRYELSISEMANLLGVPEGTVKSRLHRARMKMSKRLEEERT